MCGSLLQKLTAVSALVTLARDDEWNRRVVVEETFGGLDEESTAHDDDLTHCRQTTKELTACALLQWAARDDTNTRSSQTTRRNRGSISPLRWIANHSTSAQKNTTMAALAMWAVEHEDSRCAAAAIS